MFLHINHIVFASTILITYAERPDTMSFIIDADTICKSTRIEFTEIDCNKWKKMMTVTGHNAVICKKDGSVNINTGDPFYDCGPTIFRTKETMLVTSLNFKKDDNEEIIGINVLVHHTDPKPITCYNLFVFLMFIAIIIGLITCICNIPPEPQTTNYEVDNSDIALWWLLTDNSSCDNSWYSDDTVSYGWDKCS